VLNNEQPSPSNERFSLISLVNVDRRFSIFIATVEKLELGSSIGQNNLINRKGFNVSSSEKKNIYTTVEKTILSLASLFPMILTLHHPAARQFCRSTYTITDNSAVLINIITGVSPPHFDFFVFYVLCQC
jgi:hypothetical protein